jgi:hypothetical protein
VEPAATLQPSALGLAAIRSALSFAQKSVLARVRDFSPSCLTREQAAIALDGCIRNMMMNKALIGVLFLAFLPAIVLVVAGAVSMVRNYGVAFLWCLRFEPVRKS